MKRKTPKDVAKELLEALNTRYLTTKDDEIAVMIVNLVEDELLEDYIAEHDEPKNIFPLSVLGGGAITFFLMLLLPSALIKTHFWLLLLVLFITIGFAYYWIKRFSERMDELSLFKVYKELAHVESQRAQCMLDKYSLVVDCNEK